MTCSHQNFVEAAGLDKENMHNWCFSTPYFESSTRYLRIQIIGSSTFAETGIVFVPMINILLWQKYLAYFPLGLFILCSAYPPHFYPDFHSSYQYRLGFKQQLRLVYVFSRVFFLFAPRQFTVTVIQIPSWLDWMAYMKQIV